MAKEYFYGHSDVKSKAYRIESSSFTYTLLAQPFLLILVLNVQTANYSIILVCSQWTESVFYRIG